MSMGQILFFSGALLLVAAVLTAVFFWKKPLVYTPENAAHLQLAQEETQSLRSGYPTDRLTIRRENRKENIQEETTQLETAPLETVPLETVQLETECLEETDETGTTPL